ncbi:flp/fap pilin component [Trichococcus palustris]|uniref:Flp/fap pilin component n=1 Tax=Trichococcus palustris TaxID=140314 RepID=A0A143Y6R9_9LACT|nr:Flp family type IVb pilin [Trichococcus palustris]CZQ80824.1 flp/fap pilin component [Trichococcus palustris]SFK63800.1 pilus assembly protein Flp/PilA [Trichococcus palustris]
MEIMRRLVQEEEGQGLVEYALIIALISIAAIVAMPLLGTKISNVFEGIKDKLIVPA